MHHTPIKSKASQLKVQMKSLHRQQMKILERDVSYSRNQTALTNEYYQVL
jgi:hypothetical protein